MAKEYIEREDVLERIDGIWDCADMVFEPNDHCCNMDDCSSCKWRETKDAIRRIVEHTPNADVRPVVHARWVRSAGGDDGYCSNCHCDMPMYRENWGWMYCETNYCPNCGAKMEG
ncbi:MAG: hypothetical protein J6S60_00210 [Oscillospiraceae bacterium]|nr:hypothetical protein [Oscillospiraceae bacterium]